MWVNSRSVEPLIFSSISKPINAFKSFNIVKICNLVEIFYSQDFIKKKKSSYETSVIIIWFWFVKYEWNFVTIYILKRKLCIIFFIKIIIDKVYYVKYYCQAWLWWKIIYSFFLFFIFVCCIPNYTMFVNLLDFKKIISFSYKEDFVSRCVYIDIKVDNFVYMYITCFKIRKFIYTHLFTHILCGLF